MPARAAHLSAHHEPSLARLPLALIIATTLGASGCADFEVAESPKGSATEDVEIGVVQQALLTHSAFGQTGVQFDAQAQSEKAAGYRPMTVSAYGTSAADVRHAASYVKRAGADWKIGPLVATDFAVVPVTTVILVQARRLPRSIAALWATKEVRRERTTPA